MTPRYIPFSFLNDPHDANRGHRGYGVRDGLAMLEVTGTVSNLDYQYGGQVYNHPGARETRRGDAKPVDVTGALYKVPLQAGPGDLIVTVTRLVTHPEVEALDKRGSRRAGTDLERVLAEHWAKFFQRLTRTTVQLAPHLHGELRPGFEDRRYIDFYQSIRRGSEDVNETEASLYRKLSRKNHRGEPRTAAFLLRLDELWRGGPGYLGLFGMTGVTTGAWARIVCTRMPELLTTPGFVMAEMSPGLIPTRTGSLEYADGWGAEAILQHAF